MSLTTFVVLLSSRVSQAGPAYRLAAVVPDRSEVADQDTTIKPLFNDFDGHHGYHLLSPLNRVIGVYWHSSSVWKLGGGHGGH